MHIPYAFDPGTEVCGYVVYFFKGHCALLCRLERGWMLTSSQNDTFGLFQARRPYKDGHEKHF